MSPDQASDMLRQTFYITLLISSPVLLAGLVIGLIISVMQAVTQIQEQTLAFVPKIVAMAAVCALMLPWAGVKLMEFAKLMFQG